jgi:LCP family protein required for cell wall assembly
MADGLGGIPAAGNAAPSRPRRRVAWRVLRWTSLTLALVVLVAVVGAYLKYRSVWDSIHRVNVTVLGHRPPKYTSALNLLVFGSDSRQGLTRGQQLRWHVGANQGEVNTDTILLVHISPGRHLVTVMSLPRDTVVPAYACAKGNGYPGQQADPAAFERINSVMAAGGPACLWQTVEQQTGIHIDHFIELSFSGFVHVINDVGGVNVCVPFSVNDPVSGLTLTAGEHHIRGIQALKFWRTREGVGDGSDLQRIKRDQFLMAQTVQGILHSGLLSSPTKLLSVITDVARAMTTDAGLSQTDMFHIADSFRGLSSKNVQFVTAPNTTYPGNVAEVEFAQPQASRLFRAIAHDRKLPRASRSPGAPLPESTRHPVVLAASPRQVKVTVLNGAGRAGLAAATASTLTSRGFTVTGTGDASPSAATVIQYSSPSQRPEVKTLRKQVPHAPAEQVPGLPPGEIMLILGSDFTALKNPSPSPSPSPPGAGVGRLSKTYNGITANASCQSDSGAFQGPLSP